MNSLGHKHDEHWHTKNAVAHPLQCAPWIICREKWELMIQKNTESNRKTSLNVVRCSYIHSCAFHCSRHEWLFGSERTSLCVWNWNPVPDFRFWRAFFFCATKKLKHHLALFMAPSSSISGICSQPSAFHHADLLKETDSISELLQGERASFVHLRAGSGDRCSIRIADWGKMLCERVSSQMAITRRNTEWKKVEDRDNLLCKTICATIQAASIPGFTERCLPKYLFCSWWVIERSKHCSSKNKKESQYYHGWNSTSFPQINQTKRNSKKRFYWSIGINYTT